MDSIYKAEPEIDEIGRFLSEYNKESDRGAILIAASILDEMLLKILEAYLANVPASKELLEGINAPLGTFSARLLAAYSLGLIQENEYREINIIRKIRNEFSHKWKDVNFKSQKIYDLCRQLPWLGPGEYEEEAETDMRSRFNAEVAILTFDLIWRAKLVEKEKRTIRIWPNKTRDETTSSY